MESCRGIGHAKIALRLGTDLTESKLHDLYETACGFAGDVWEYQGTDAGGLWMVASGLPAVVRLVCDGVRADVAERARIARRDLVMEHQTQI